MKRISLLMVCLMLILISCEHTHSDNPHNPTVMIMTPTSGATYNNNDTVHMTIHMEDEEELHEGFIYLKSATDTFFSYQPTVHALQMYDLDTFWVVTGIISTTMADVTVIAENHDSGADTAVTDIQLMP